MRRDRELSAAGRKKQKRRKGGNFVLAFVSPGHRWFIKGILPSQTSCKEPSNLRWVGRFAPRAPDVKTVTERSLMPSPSDHVRHSQLPFPSRGARGATRPTHQRFGGSLHDVWLGRIPFMNHRWPRETKAGMEFPPFRRSCFFRPAADRSRSRCMREANGDYPISSGESR